MNNNFERFLFEIYQIGRTILEIMIKSLIFNNADFVNYFLKPENLS